MLQKSLITAILFAGTLAAQGLPSVTFHRDVLPILQKHCQTCHRPGEAAPMSFLTYQDVRPWAKAMKTAVALRKMPPWFADPQFGHFLNDRSLTQKEIETIARWADTGAAEGDPAEVTFNEDVELVYMMPHMHVRGKDMTYTLLYPDGRKQIVLSVPHYDFNWQLGYSTLITVPKGTKLRVDAHYDNSPNNRWNPNPNKTVYYGEMTWEEMMFPFFGVVIDQRQDPAKILSGRRPVPPGA